MTLTIGKEADTVITAAVTAGTTRTAPARSAQPPARIGWTSRTDLAGLTDLPDLASRADRTTRTAQTALMTGAERPAVEERRPTTGPLAAHVELREEGAVIRLEGLLVAGAITAARTAVDRAAVLGSRQIVVDLGGVRAVDPYGAVLLGAMSRHAARRGCRLRLRNAGLPVRQALAGRGVRIEAASAVSSA